MATAYQSTASSGLSHVRAAVVQAAPVLFESPKSLQKLADLTADAAQKKAELVVFPEAFIGGYYKGHDFGVSIGVRTTEGRDEFRRLFENSIDVPGKATEFIGSVARDYAVHLVVGVIERDGGTLYCTALIFGPEGPLLGKHRKLMPTAMERVIWGNGDGSTLPVVTTTIGKIGSVICWENYMPLLRTAMYAKGIELYCAITVDDRETWIPTITHIALEGRCFVLSACQFLQRSDLPSDYPTEQFPCQPGRVDPGRKLHRRAVGTSLGRAEVRGRVHSDGRSRPGRSCPGQVRLRCGRSLFPPGRVQARSQRAADEIGVV